MTSFLLPGKLSVGAACCVGGAVGLYPILPLARRSVPGGTLRFAAMGFSARESSTRRGVSSETYSESYKIRKTDI